jgi:hypothetical protein
MFARQTTQRGAVLASAVLVLAGLATAAGSPQDKGKPALRGEWAQQGGEVKIEFGDKDVLKIMPHGDNQVIVIVCSYTVNKDKRVQAKITELEGKAADKAKDLLPVGLEFSFTWQVKDNVATLGDVQGKKVDVFKTHLEGKFDKK